MQNPIPETMSAVLLTGRGGYDMLQYSSDVAASAPNVDDVLIQVASAAPRPALLQGR